MPRTNISIADDVAEKMSEEAMKRHKTLYAFANESLEAVVGVCRLSGEPDEILPSWKLGKMLKEVDAVPVPGDVLEKLVRKLYGAEKEWLLGVWFAEGERIGNYLRMGYPELSGLAQAAVEFRGLLPLRRLEFRSVDEGGTKGQLVVRAVGAGQSAETTACAEQFIRGVIESYSFKVRGSRTSEGIIELKVSP